MLAKYRRMISGAAVASACLLVAPSSQGIVYTGEFDPLFEFQGIAQLKIEGDCLPSTAAATLISVASCISSGVVDLLGATVTESPPGNLPTGTLTFPAVSDVPEIAWLYFDNFALIGVTTMIMPASSNSGLLYPGLASDWGLEFLADGNSDETFDDPVVNLYHWELVCNGDCTSAWVLAGNPATDVRFTPEPGSLALILGALGAGWLLRRRQLPG